MRPRRCNRIPALCLLAASLVGAGGCASQARLFTRTMTSSDWSKVEALPQGTKVVVERRGANPISGATRKVATDSIEIAVSAGSVVIDRLEVHRVLRTRSQAAPRAAWGMAIGAVGGVLQAVLLTESDQLLFAGMFGGGWAVIGGTIGGISGVGRSEILVVYAVIDPNPPPPTSGSPMAKRLSFPSAAVGRMTTSASPSLGATTYANHFPSLDVVTLRMFFQNERSAGSSSRRADRAPAGMEACAGAWHGTTETRPTVQATRSTREARAAREGRQARESDICGYSAAGFRLERQSDARARDLFHATADIDSIPVYEEVVRDVDVGQRGPSPRPSRYVGAQELAIGAYGTHGTHAYVKTDRGASPLRRQRAL